jgi:hypothetical protein
LRFHCISHVNNFAAKKLKRYKLCKMQLGDGIL